MGTTPNRLYPYADPADPADVAGHLQEMAEAIDADVCALTDAVASRPSARFRGTGTFVSESTAFPLTAPPFPSFFRLPFNIEDYDTADVDMQPQEVGNRLIKPNQAGFYFCLATLQVPTLTLAATVNFMGFQLRKGNAASPLLGATRLSGDSHNIPVNADDRNVRIFSVGGGSFMNGTTDAFCLEFRADTTPDVAGYPVYERSLTLIKMT